MRVLAHGFLAAPRARCRAVHLRAGRQGRSSLARAIGVPAHFATYRRQGDRPEADPFLLKNPTTPAQYKELGALGKVDVLLVSHGHFDHIADAPALATLNKIPLWGPGGASNATLMTLGVLPPRNYPTSRCASSCRWPRRRGHQRARGGAEDGRVDGPAGIVENKPSAAASSSPRGRKAEPDGYTLLFITNGNSVSESLFKSLPYNSVRDFAPVSPVGFIDFELVSRTTPTSSRWAISRAHAREPGKLNIGTINPGSGQHLALSSSVDVRRGCADHHLQEHLGSDHRGDLRAGAGRARHRRAGDGAGERRRDADHAGRRDSVRRFCPSSDRAESASPVTSRSPGTASPHRSRRLPRSSSGWTRRCGRGAAPDVRSASRT